jgi:hypothetical protein
MVKNQDFSKFFPEKKLTKKELLLKRCTELGISPFIDDSSEVASSELLDMRAVASEVELEKRINEKTSLAQAGKANTIAFYALLFSILSTGISLYALFKV